MSFFWGLLVRYVPTFGGYWSAPWFLFEELPRSRQEDNAEVAFWEGFTVNGSLALRKLGDLVHFGPGYRQS